ncbi:hypothetical protein [uncultured Campylobacter sp.]|uniref:hypothetical protein n=1 Tax=uncultured Campylobacter sp. TaxID=218934 RepID=UPI00260C50B5|nr:hypothetical protein [uncultured Campylobacter sp.]
MQVQRPCFCARSHTQSTKDALCRATTSNDIQGVSRKISNDDALCGMQSYARIAEAHSTAAQTHAHGVSIPVAHGKGWMIA